MLKSLKRISKVTQIPEPKRTLNHLSCNLELHGFMDDHLDFVSYFARYSAHQIGIPTSEIIHLPTKIQKWHVNKGPFVHAKTKEVFERKTYRRLVQAFDSHPETINAWMDYVNKNLPHGIRMEVTRFEYQPINFVESIQVPPKTRKQTGMDQIQSEIDAFHSKYKQ